MNCCNEHKEKGDKEKKGFLTGVLYGLVPHTFCILFIIFTILGVTTATTLLRPLLLSPYFFYILIALSFIFVTIAAVVYLHKSGILSLEGAKRKWRYLSVLYGVTISVNLLLFMVIFPITANLSPGSNVMTALGYAFGGVQSSASGPLLTLQVDIPCPGHALLIIGELETIDGVKNVKYRFPNFFDVPYDSAKTSREEILSLEIFETYRAEVVRGGSPQTAESRNIFEQIVDQELNRQRTQNYENQ